MNLWIREFSGQPASIPANRPVADGYTSIKNKIENSDIKDLPGVVEPENAVHLSETKRHAVEQFSEVDVEDLPVVDDRGKFVGVINRGRLLSDLLASILRFAKNSD